MQSNLARLAAATLVAVGHIALLLVHTPTTMSEATGADKLAMRQRAYPQR